MSRRWRERSSGTIQQALLTLRACTFLAHIYLLDCLIASSCMGGRIPPGSNSPMQYTLNACMHGSMLPAFIVESRFLALDQICLGPTVASPPCSNEEDTSAVALPLLRCWGS